MYKTFHIRLSCVAPIAYSYRNCFLPVAYKRSIQEFCRITRHSDLSEFGCLNRFLSRTFFCELGCTCRRRRCFFCCFFHCHIFHLYFQQKKHHVHCLRIRYQFVGIFVFLSVCFFCTLFKLCFGRLGKETKRWTTGTVAARRTTEVFEAPKTSRGCIHPESYIWWSFEGQNSVSVFFGLFFFYMERRFLRC